MILLIDNYDSFVYNLARYVEELGCETHVVRNDATTVEEIKGWAPQAIIISPGPCTPTEAGISLDVVRQLGSQIPMLGVCLGHQVIAAAYGAKIVCAPRPIHGQTSPISHEQTSLFANMTQPLIATRYHSLIVERETLPACLHVTAETADGLVMGIEHETHPNFGVQFHPESVLTEGGHQLLKTFLELAGVPTQSCPEGDLNSESHVADGLRNAQIDGKPIHW